MPKNSKYILLLQPQNGGSDKAVFEITPAKAQKVIDLLEPEIRKHKGKPTPSMTLEPFFTNYQEVKN